MQIIACLELIVMFVFIFPAICSAASDDVQYRRSRFRQPIGTEDGVSLLACAFICSRRGDCIHVNYRNESTSCEFVEKTGYFQEYVATANEGWIVYNDVTGIAGVVQRKMLKLRKTLKYNIFFFFSLHFLTFFVGTSQC